MKKFGFFAFILALACSGVAFASGQHQQGTQPSQRTITFWTISLKSHFSNYIEGMLTQYQKEHPGVVINWQDVPGPQVTDKFLASVAANEPPDVANMYNIAQLISKGAVLDVTPYITPQERAQYIPDFLKAFQFGNKLYALPWYTGTYQTVYSQKILDEAGISSPPATLSEVLKDGAIIHQKTGKYGFEPVLTGGKNFIIAMMAADGIPLFSPDHKKAIFDTPATQQLVAELQKGYQDGAIAPESINASLDDGTQDFLQGQAAFFDEGPWVFDRSTPDVQKQLGWKVTNGIRGNEGYIGDAQELIVSKSTKNPKLAVNFATFVENAPNEVAFSKLVAIYPGDVDAAKDPYFTTATPASATQSYEQLGAKQLSQTIIAPWNAPPVPQWNQLNQDFSQKIAAVFTSGASIPQTLATIQSDWDSILQNGQ